MDPDNTDRPSDEQRLPSPDARSPAEPFGKYFLIDRIAVGGMAEVFRARTYGEGGFEKELVIKRILSHLTDNHDFVTMFVEEAKLTVLLQHPNIVQVYDFGKIRGHYYLAMEGVYGTDLKTLAEKIDDTGGTLPLKFAAYVAHEVARGLHHAHHQRDERGVPLDIVHRDVSPSNVLIGYDGQVKLVDFGIAKASKSAFADSEEGVLKGKFEYMSPEQARGEGSAVDVRSDVFATGICLWEMLTGRRLFRDETDLATLKRVRSGEVPPVHEINPDVPAGLARITHRALAARPDDRYNDAEALRHDLEEWLKPSTVPELAQDAAAWIQETFREERAQEQARLERGRTAAAALVRMEDTVELEFDDDEVEPDAVDTIDDLPVIAPEAERTPAPAPKRPMGLIIAGLVLLLAVLIGGGAFAAFRLGLFSPAAPDPGPGDDARPGVLLVEILPSEAGDAAILLDGDPIQVPFEALEADRDYTLSVRKEGYEPYEETFRVGAGERYRIRAALLAIADEPTPEEPPTAAADGGEGTPEPPTPPPADTPPAILFSSSPGGAEVVLDGRVVGRATHRFSTGTPGTRYDATFRLDGYEDARAGGVFPASGTITVRAALTKLPEVQAPGFLTINATPWADVYVDGALVGQTPIGTLEVTPGAHTVRLVCPPLQAERTIPVTVESGQTKPISADLEE